MLLLEIALIYSFRRSPPLGDIARFWTQAPSTVVHCVPLFIICIQDCLLEARMVKANKRRENWIVCNCRKKQMDLFKQLNTPMSVEY